MLAVAVAAKAGPEAPVAPVAKVELVVKEDEATIHGPAVLAVLAVLVAPEELVELVE